MTRIATGSPAEPEWLDLGHGITVQCRLFDPVADLAASRAYARALQATPDDPDFAVADLEDLAALARRTVVAWRGIDDACTPEAAEAVIRQGIVDDGGQPRSLALAFKVAFFMARNRWSVEGNGSRPSPNGTGSAAGAAAEEPGSAADAAISTLPAPQPSPGDAPITSTPRKRRQAA